LAGADTHDQDSGREDIEVMAAAKSDWALTLVGRVEVRLASQSATAMIADAMTP
jgi:hypothetical protein